MHRSCFALIVLFAVLAGSLLTVRSAQAQMPFNGFMRISATASESIGPSSNEYSNATGYDEAYDSAMFDEGYPVLDEANSQDDVENIGVAKCHEIPMQSCLGPGSSVCFDDEYVGEPDSCCLDGVVCPLAGSADVTVDMTDIENGDGGVDVREDGDAGSEVTGTTEDGEAVGPVGAAASADDAADAHTVQSFLWNSVASTVRDAGQFAQTYGLATWPSIVWQRPDTQEFFVAVTETVQQAWESTVTESYLQQQYSEEIVMLEVANGLDHVANHLQDAAHFLRFKAADRIVSKSHQRRVANRVD